MIKVLFLGPLKDVATMSETEMDDVSACADLDALKSHIAKDNPGLLDALMEPSIRTIINQSVLVDDAIPKDIEEIAFMPPLSGG